MGEFLCRTGPGPREEHAVWSDWPSLVTRFGEFLQQEEMTKRYSAEHQSAREKLAALDERWPAGVVEIVEEPRPRSGCVNMAREAKASAAICR